MEGRRVSSKNQKYNPLFILFLCLIAAVAILLVVSIVLGARLGKANKNLKAAEEQVTKLEQDITKLQDDLAAAQARASSGNTSSSGGSGTSSTQPAIPGTEPVAGSSWLDLSGHSEVKVKPTTLLDGYTTYYTTAGVNLRSGPATSYDRITTVDYGEKVEVAARQDNWSFVKYGTRFGWISSDYLSTTQPAVQTATTRTSANSGSSTRSEATSGSLRR